MIYDLNFLFSLIYLFWPQHLACGLPISRSGSNSGPWQRRAESQPLDCQGIPYDSVFRRRTQGLERQQRTPTQDLLRGFWHFLIIGCWPPCGWEIVQNRTLTLGPNTAAQARRPPQARDSYPPGQDACYLHSRDARSLQVTHAIQELLSDPPIGTQELGSRLGIFLRMQGVQRIQVPAGRFLRRQLGIQHTTNWPRVQVRKNMSGRHWDVYFIF